MLGLWLAELSRLLSDMKSNVLAAARDAAVLPAAASSGVSSHNSELLGASVNLLCVEELPWQSIVVVHAIGLHMMDDDVGTAGGSLSRMNWPHICINA